MLNNFSFSSNAGLFLKIVFEQGSSRLPTTKLPSEKCRKLSPTGSKVQNDQEIISEFELDSIIGITDSPELEVTHTNFL